MATQEAKTAAGSRGQQTRGKNRKRPRRVRAREAGGAQRQRPGRVVGLPPKAPEDFSRNWKALQELLRQKSQAPEKPLVLAQTESKKPPKINQQNKKEVSAKARRDERNPEKTDHGATGGSGPPGSVTCKSPPAPPSKANRAEDGKGAVKRLNGDVPWKPGDGKHKKQKTKETSAALAPATPTEDDIWFDDVDPVDIEAAMGPEAAQIARKRLGQSGSSMSLVKEQAFGGLTRALAMDCEMVGVGPNGEESAAARVSIVNQFGKCVYDKYIKPAQPVTDYRTAVSGIRPEHIKQGEKLEVVQKEVAAMLKGRVLVGHALHNDLKVLYLDHPKKQIRDTQKYKPFKFKVKSGRPSLKLLAEKILGIQMQQAEHCSIQDAQAAMRLYITVKKDWENITRDRRPPATAPQEHSA